MFRRSGRSYGNANQTIANDLDRFKIYTIVRIELNSIQAIEVVSVVGVVCDRLGSSWVAFPYDRPDRLNIFLGRYGLSYGNQALQYIYGDNSEPSVEQLTEYLSSEVS